MFEAMDVSLQPLELYTEVLELLGFGGKCDKGKFGKQCCRLTQETGQGNAYYMMLQRHRAMLEIKDIPKEFIEIYKGVEMDKQNSTLDAK
jgi:hypothetical protein